MLRLLPTLLLLGVAAAEPQILDFSLSNNKVNPFASVIATCKISGLMPGYTISYFKEVVNHSFAADIAWWPISYGPNSTYSDLPYKFEVKEKNDLTEYIMNITNIMQDMSGNYSCAVSSAHSHTNRTAELNVIAEPVSVEIRVDGKTIYPDSTFVSNLSVSHTLECIAHEGNPEAQIEIWHGNQNLRSQISSITVGPPMYGPPRSVKHSQLATIRRNTVAVIPNWKVDVTYHNAALTCLARVDIRTPGMTTKFTPVVDDGPPGFVCNDTYELPESAEDGFEFSCLVMAKPPLINASFGCQTTEICDFFTGFPINTWHPKPDTVYSGIIRNADTENRGAMPTKIRKGTMTMKIRMAREDILGRVFTFKAENEMGTALHQVKLINGAAVHKISGIIMTIGGILYIFQFLL